MGHGSNQLRKEDQAGRHREVSMVDGVSSRDQGDRWEGGRCNNSSHSIKISTSSIRTIS